MCSENKGVNQLRDYCEADLRLCFFANAKSQFSHDLSHFQLLEASSNQQVCRKEEKHLIKELFLKFAKLSEHNRMLLK